MCVLTDGDLDTYPHVLFTSDLPWNPCILDNEYPIGDFPSFPSDGILPAYRSHHVNDYRGIFATSRVPKPFVLDPLTVQPNLGFVPTIRIEHTLDNTTQHARLDTRLLMRKHFKTRFPAANVNRLLETFATDILFLIPQL
jgi:hypothetical protein